MKNICVFCGSAHGTKQIYRESAKTLGTLMAHQKKNLIYGGGKVGLMGTVADAVMGNGSEVIGVIPEFLYKKEVGHEGLTELIIVQSMHERKQKMAELADAFIALPGGMGTLEELAEISTWVQLELIKKPIALLNIDGFYDHLFAQFDYMVDQGFVRPENRKMLLNVKSIEEVINQLEQYEFEDYSIWDTLDKT